MYSGVRLPIQPSLILTRIHWLAHGCLAAAYLTVPLSAVIYIAPLLAIQAVMLKRLMYSKYTFQKPRTLHFNNHDVSLSYLEQQAVPIRGVSIEALWSSLLIIRYIDPRGKKAWLWIHENETDLEAFRKLKVLATIGRLEQDNKRVL